MSTKPINSPFDDWEPVYSYLIPTRKRRRRCLEFRRNLSWDGTLQNKAAARDDDPDTSKDAAESIPDLDVFLAKFLVDRILGRNGGTVVSIELREEAMAGIAAGLIDTKGYPVHVRAESIRRRFSDLCPD